MEHRPISDEAYYAIMGEEGYKEVFSSVSNTSLKGAQFIAGKTADAFKTLFTEASKELIKALGTNKMKIEKAEKQAKQHHPSLFFTTDVLKQLSSSGSSETLIKDAKALVEAIKIIKAFTLDAQTLSEKQSSLFKDYKGIKTTEKAIKVLKDLDDLTFPVPDFPHKENVMLVTNILPRNKVWSFNTESHSFSIKDADNEVNDKPEKNALSSDDVDILLKEVKKLEEIYRFIAKANQDYLAYLKKFNIVVKESFEYLDKTDDVLSSSVKRDLLSRLEGDKYVFGFYTGFLPKVVNYVDEYIDILTSYLISKTR